jgi:hypothetical protein
MDNIFFLIFGLILVAGVIILVYTVVRIISQLQSIMAGFDAMKSELQEIKGVQKEYLGKICDGLIALTCSFRLK